MNEKLYTKNEKGRYVPYVEPEPLYRNCLYKKVKRGRKYVYEPYSMTVGNDLPEGVWVVVKTLYGKSYVSGRYLNDCFMCMKASDIQDVSLAKLGGMDKLADWLCHNLDKLPKNTSQYDFCRAIVGLLFQYENRNGENDNML